MTVEIRINNKAFAQLEAAPQVLEDAAIEALTRAGAIFESQAAKNVPVVFGVLRGSVFSELRGSRAQGYEEIVAAGGPSAPYARTVEYGGPPRRVPFFALMRWAKKKFSLEESSAWLVARKVQERIEIQGTKGQYPFNRAWGQRKDEIIRQVRNIIRRAVRTFMKGASGPEAAS